MWRPGLWLRKRNSGVGMVLYLYLGVAGREILGLSVCVVECNIEAIGRVCTKCVAIVADENESPQMTLNREKALCLIMNSIKISTVTNDTRSFSLQAPSQSGDVF